MDNPFEIFTYQGPDYFCDRETELEELIDAFVNRRNIVIASPRKLGKTNLIHHVHHYLGKRKDVICIYIDVMDTSSDQEFVNAFITGVLNSLADNEGIIKKFSETFKRFSPEVSFDPLTNLPKFRVHISTPEEYKYSFDAVMKLLVSRKEKIQIAIDEFQQIEQYKEKSRIDATLRSYFPIAKNLHFIFSGSEAHLLNTLFRDYSRPLFSSTGWMNLGFIGYDLYHKFIEKNFSDSEIDIEDQDIYEILKWTDGHTFYTQYLCNMIYLYAKKGHHNLIDMCKARCLKEFESSFRMYRSSLPSVQFNTLKAIAQENGASEITSRDFLSKYGLSASSSRRSVEALIDKQFVREELKEDKSHYLINDIFLKRWLQTKYS